MKRENENLEMDPRDMIQQNRSARRKARMSKIGQDGRFSPKVEKLKKGRYTRKQKHKGGRDGDGA